MFGKQAFARLRASFTAGLIRLTASSPDLEQVHEGYRLLGLVSATTAITLKAITLVFQFVSQGR